MDRASVIDMQAARADREIRDAEMMYEQAVNALAAHVDDHLEENYVDPTSFVYDLGVLVTAIRHHKQVLDHVNHIHENNEKGN